MTLVGGLRKPDPGGGASWPVWRRLAERPAAEGADLGVEPGADAAHLALADALDPEGPDEVVDPPRGHPRQVCLLDDREQGALGATSGLEQQGEVVASRERLRRGDDRRRDGRRSA